MTHDAALSGTPETAERIRHARRRDARARARDGPRGAADAKPQSSWNRQLAGAVRAWRRSPARRPPDPTHGVELLSGRNRSVYFSTQGPLGTWAEGDGNEARGERWRWQSNEMGRRVSNGPSPGSENNTKEISHVCLPDSRLNPASFPEALRSSRSLVSQASLLSPSAPR